MIKSYISRCIYAIAALLLTESIQVSAQAVNDHKYKVVFLGNSYTYVNSLPQMTASAAASVGDTLVHSMSATGGYMLRQHLQDATSMGLLAAGGYDYVVQQEQSQWPSFPDGQVDTGMFVYAKRIDSFVHHYSSCGRSMFYMTWGRKNGDASNCGSWPPVCTYSGMDSLINLRYMAMADSNDGVVSPVGAVWRYIRNTYPSIALYQADESHPEVAGTYAAACCFYTAIFKRDPTRITFNSTLSATDAANIRTAVKKVVYDSMSKWHIKEYSASAQFTYTVTGNNVAFNNTSANSTDYVWLFGDSQTSTLASPTHNYSIRGIYTVKLVAINCGKSDTMKVTVNLNPVGVALAVEASGDVMLAPNPAHDVLHVRSALLATSACRVVVMNVAGQVVYSEAVSGLADHAIDIHALSSGVYMLSVTGGDGVVYRGRFVRE